MKEDFLYYVWQYKRFNVSSLFTTNQKEIVIKRAGQLNTNEGPDFLNAQIIIDQQLWAGNVEMHVKSSDWYVHKHENDTNYDDVILHVVWEDDVTVFMPNNQPLPTLVLQNYIDTGLIHQYQALLHNNKDWIPCGAQITSARSFVLTHWLERLFFERLEAKSTMIQSLLEKSNQNYEAVFFQLLAKNFGLKRNGDAFLTFANSFDFSVLKKVRANETQLAALFYGQANLLSEPSEIEYEKELMQAYQYLKHKHKLKPIPKNTFQFFRMRPSNFPTIRMAQLVAIVHQHQSLFSTVINLKEKIAFYDLFAVTVPTFWKNHYTFAKESKITHKKITTSFVDLLLLNTILPLQFVYHKNRGEDFKEAMLDLVRQIASEKNSIVAGFSSYGIATSSAMESQALLQLKNNYCTKKRCLQCAIGNDLLQS